MKRFGLIGKSLAHSFSARYFNDKFEREGIDAEYNLYPLDDIDQLKELVQDEALSGFNVTIPYKQDVLERVHAFSPESVEVGATNCVLVGKKIWTAYNTDVFGFRQTLTPLIHGKPVKTAMILGSGGGSKAVRYVLRQLGIHFKIVSRSGFKTYSNLKAKEVAACDLIINTTPLGMHPDVDSCPQIPYDALTERHIAYDLVYNPTETEFLRRCAARGATIQNGLPMLYAQADKSWEIWNG